MFFVDQVGVQPEEDDAAALAALREVHRPARKKDDSRAEQRGTLTDAVDAVDAKHPDAEAALA